MSLFNWGRKIHKIEPPQSGKKKPFEQLSPQQLITKISELPWVETRTGIPGVSVHELLTRDTAQEDIALLHYCKSHSMVNEVSSPSLNGNGFYVYAPDIVEQILKKPEFQHEKDQDKTHVQQFLVRGIRQLQFLMGKFGLKNDLPHSVTVPEDTINSEINNILKNAPNPDRLKLSVTHTDKGVLYNFTESSIGRALGASFYLEAREREFQNSKQVD